jgi:hypothetical protein
MWLFKEPDAPDTGPRVCSRGASGQGTEIPAANYDATCMPNLDDGAPTRTSALNAAAELVDLGRDRNDRSKHCGHGNDD